MEITERLVELSIARAASFFKTVSRNPVVRGELLSRGLTDEELRRGWSLYSAVLGFGPDSNVQAAASVPETSAARALNAIDAWDAPTFTAAKAVLEARHPKVSAFLFADLAPATGPAAVAGAERFLERISMLRDGRAPGVAPQAGKAASELLSLRRLLDAEQEAELRKLVATAKSGAQPNELRVSEPDPARDEQARAFVVSRSEWREIARVSIKRRDYQIALGLAQRRVKKPAGPVEPTPSERAGVRSRGPGRRGDYSAAAPEPCSASTTSKSSSLPSTPMRMTLRGASSPRRMRSASGASTRRAMVRFIGLAPSAGS